MDSCQPNKNKSLKSFRIYSIVVPTLIFTVILEAIFVFMAIPQTLGNALTITGKLPVLPPGIPLYAKV